MDSPGAENGNDSQRTSLPVLSPHDISIDLITESEKEEFLRAILPAFLDIVNPRQDGLLDFLTSVQIITNEDNSSLSGKDVTTRRDQARKLFVILTKVPVDIFTSKVVPELRSKFPHIIPERFQEKSSQNGHRTLDMATASHRPPVYHCLRHTIMDSRIRPMKLADIFYHKGFMNLSTFGNVSAEESRYKRDQVWATIFDVFEKTGPEKPDVLANILRSFFVILHMPEPPDLEKRVSNGLLCTCSPTSSLAPAGKPSSSAKVGTWLMHPGHELTFRSIDSRPDSLFSISDAHSFVSRTTFRDSDSDATLTGTIRKHKADATRESRGDALVEEDETAGRETLKETVAVQTVESAIQMESGTRVESEALVESEIQTSVRSADQTLPTADAESGGSVVHSTGVVASAYTPKRERSQLCCKRKFTIILSFFLLLIYTGITIAAFWFINDEKCYKINEQILKIMHP